MDSRRLGSSGVSVIGRLLRQARPYWPHLALTFVLSSLAAPLALLVPLPLKIVVDSIIGAQPVPAFLRAVLPQVVESSEGALVALVVVLVVAIAVLVHAQSLLTLWLRTYVGERLLLEFRSRLFHYVQRLSIAYHDMKGTSDSLYRIQYDAMSIRSYTIDGLLPLITSLLTLVGMICVTAYLDWQIAVVALLVTPVLYVLTVIYRRRLRSHWRELKQLESAAMSVIQESLSAARVVKAFGGEDFEQDRFMSRSSKGVDASLRVYLSQGRYNLLIGLTTAVGTAAALYIGIRHVQSGALTLGGLLVIMTYLAQLYEPLKSLGQKVTGLQNAFAGAERVFAVLDEKPDVEEVPHARPLHRARGDLVFDHVTFGYDRERPVLHDVSFAVPAGTCLGIMGPTGSGKSTLTSLMLRFFDPSEGSIKLDGIDVRECKVADVRNQFAVVLQDTVMFSSTIAENIRYARPRATMEEIVSAAEAAGAHEFISRLPDGYDTQVGERGMRLSGGERQRLSIARAFLKDAPLLILDEPTSSLDMQTERAVMGAIHRLMRGRTTILIAHRLTTLSGCDALITLREGRVVEISTRVDQVLAESLVSAGIQPDRLQVVSGGSNDSQR